MLRQRRLEAPASALGILGRALLFVCSGCTVLLNRDHDQCQSSRDCQALAVGAVCTSDGLCVKNDPVQSALCRRDADCSGWSVCRASTCRALAAQTCVQVGTANALDQRERLPIGLLVEQGDLHGGSTQTGVLKAASTVIKELNDALTENSSVPRLVAVACADDDAAGLQNLLDAGVRILVGPALSESVETISDLVGQNALLFAPFADAPMYVATQRRVALSSSIVSCKPNRQETSPALFAAVDFLRKRRSGANGTTVLAVSDQERKLGIADMFKDELAAHHIQSLLYDVNARGNGILNALHATPSLVVAATAEAEWGNNIQAIDRHLEYEGELLPYYLLSEQRSDVLTMVTNDKSLEPPERERVFGLDYAQSNENLMVHGRFASAFKANAAEGGLAGDGLQLDYVHDCTFLAVYAALAAQFRFALAPSGLSPEALLFGLLALSGGQSMDIDDTASLVHALDAAHGKGGAVRLLGASGDLDLVDLPEEAEIRDSLANVYLRPKPRSQELYCVEPTRNKFCNSGLVFPATGGPPEGRKAGCPCFAN